MTHTRFRSLARREQLRWVFQHGTHLAWRLGTSGRLHLYYLPTADRGFFVELAYDDAADALYVTQSVPGTLLLEQYSRQVRLPDV